LGPTILSFQDAIISGATQYVSFRQGTPPKFTIGRKMMDWKFYFLANIWIWDIYVKFRGTKKTWTNQKQTKNTRKKQTKET